MQVGEWSLRFPKRSTIAVAAVLSALLGAFWFIAEDVSEGETRAFDEMVVGWFRDAANPGHAIGPSWLEEAMRDVTSLGSFSVLTLIVVFVVGFLLITRRRLDALYLLAAVGTGTVLSMVLKAVFDRPRPELAASARIFSPSFPSGHATISAVVFLTLGALLASEVQSRALAVFFVGSATTLTVLVGLTRIYLGVHYPTDVAAGWALGASWALLCWALLAALRRRSAAPLAAAQPAGVTQA